MLKQNRFRYKVSYIWFANTMRLGTRFLLIILFGVFTLVGRTQSITNAGTDFVLAFTETLDSTDVIFWVNISGSQNATGTVDIPGTGFTRNFSVTPGSISRVDIPSNLAFIRGSDTLVSRAIRVRSSNDVVVYALMYRRFRHEASLVLPTSAVGNRYRVISYHSEIKNTRLYQSEFNIVTSNDSVEVEITPSANIRGGRSAGVPYRVKIPPYSVYQAQADSVRDDLTGSLIETVDPRQNISVFGGNEWSTVVCRPNSDPLYEQMFPVSTWGKEYLVVPTNTVFKDYYRVIADEDSTEVYRNDTLVANLSSGQFYDDTLTYAAEYRSNKPIAVAQFLITGQLGCSPNPQTDPSMIVLNSNEQMFLDSITFFAVDTNQLDTHYVNILTRTTDTATIFLDGIQQSGFTVFNADTNYAYVSVSVSPGSHTLVTSGCGFLAYSMGYGRAVSYAYAAGVLLVDLDNQVKFSNLTSGSDTVCINDSLQFQLATLGTPISFNWDFGDGTGDTTATPKKKYDTAGTFAYSVIIEYQCFVDTLYDTLEITPSPIVDLGGDTVLCASNRIELDAGNRGMFHVWSTGDTSQSIEVIRSGIYSVSVTNAICFDADTISVDIPIKGASYQWFPIDPNKQNICSGDTLLFFSSYVDTPLTKIFNMDDGNLIPDLDGDLSYSFDEGGQYIVTLEADYFCDGRRVTFEYPDTINVSTQPQTDLGEDTTLCLRDTFRLEAGGQAETYLWSPNGETTSSIKVIESGLYSVLTANGSCISEDEIFVEIPTELTVPNVFTPDGDGLNDFFRLEGINTCQDYEMSVYNRWGELIFFTDMVHGSGWDGRTFAGREAPEGVYFFVLKRNGENYHGTVSLLR